MVHDIGLTIHDRAGVKPVGQQVARPHIRLAKHWQGTGMVGERRKTGRFGQFGGHLSSQGNFLVMHTTQQAHQHFQSLIIEQHFLQTEGTIHQQMKMILPGIQRGSRPPPTSCGIEMQADDEVGMQGLIHPVRARPDFGVAVKELFGLPAHRMHP